MNIQTWFRSGYDREAPAASVFDDVSANGLRLGTALLFNIICFYRTIMNYPLAFSLRKSALVSKALSSLPILDFFPEAKALLSFRRKNASLLFENGCFHILGVIPFDQQQLLVYRCNIAVKLAA